MNRSNTMQMNLLNEWVFNGTKLSFFWKRGGIEEGSSGIRQFRCNVVRFGAKMLSPGRTCVHFCRNPWSMKVPLLFLFTQLSFSAYAQDSLRDKNSVPEGYPIVKLLIIQKEYFGNSDFKLFAKDRQEQEKGEFSGARLRIFGMLPAYTKHNFSIIVGGTYTREQLSYYRNTSPASPNYEKGKINKDDFDVVFSLGYNHTLFGKMVISRASVTMGSSNFFNVKKLAGTLSSSLILKRSANTISVLGLMGNLDQSTILPVFPVYSYWHKFDNGL